MENFVDTFAYKLIYVMRINDEAHKGLLKIGETTIRTKKAVNELVENCSDLNGAAKKRINEYTSVAGISYELLHTEIALKEVIRNEEKIIKAFSDHDVHDVLEKSGIKNVTVNNTTGKEWYKVDLETAKNAIKAVKENRKALKNIEITENRSPIIFRPEQEKAIKDTIKQFRNGSRMLWNAKMRFGKTLSALQVIKEMGFEKTIILTHRPVVDAGWYEDFQKIFYDKSDYNYCSNGFGEDITTLLKRKEKVVCFYSIQYLRNSKRVGGQYEGKEEIFDTNWDLVVVDEAHEGTTTLLGDNVIKEILKENNGYDTKFLALSGTPFNILNEYDQNVYTWDYVMEQRAKKEWDAVNFGDSNPYKGLPEMKIYTYNLGDIIQSKAYEELEDKAFNFREFFRTWKGDKKCDGAVMPKNASVGDFCHEKDVESFLNLITKSDKDTMYPYSTEENRELFKHSLWMVPGVNEAKALSKLMKKHPVFGNENLFKIVNVAGAGDEEEASEEALKKVKSAISDALKNQSYTITISCGKLTTGVTIPEWTAVMMLAGSFSTSAAQYLQTIFRVQSPANINGKTKEACYVFDFAPDRTLKMIADAVKVSHKAGKGTESDRQIMGEFLNYCPVISIDGTKMKKYNTDNLLQQLKRAYADRAVQNGFDDISLYNDELLKLDELELKEFSKLKGIIGTTKAQAKTNEININNQGFTEEEYEKIKEIEKKPKRERTPEEEEELRKLREKKKQKTDAISILRGVSIRIPLLIYGVDFDIDEDITIEKLVENIDTESWNEFMPQGVTKEIFNKFLKYYDKDVFVAAGKRIRNTVKGADALEPTERIAKITGLFSYFRNPDKETVLTPWRVVNMHMSDCIGGYDFFDEEHNELLEEPRYVLQKEVTENIFDDPKTKILEINSKTGLYPLYVTYSVYRRKCEKYKKEELTTELKNKLWLETVNDNIFIICKTPMAKLITKRTLLGYKNGKINAHAFDDLINQIVNKSNSFTTKILKPRFWNKEGEIMKFNAIVGNPPYQMMDGGNGVSAKPIYNRFVEEAKELNSQYLSMIMPARWYAGGKGLDEFRSKMLNDENISKLFDFETSRDCFRDVDIAGGVCYFLRDKSHKGECQITTYSNGKKNVSNRKLNEYDIFIRSSQSLSIIEKIKSNNSEWLSEKVSSRKPFGLVTNYKPRRKGIPCWFIQRIGLQYAAPEDVTDINNYLDKWKLLLPKSPIAGQTDFSKPVGFYYDGNVIIAKPGECCTESYIVAGVFETEAETLNYKSYIFTKIIRFLLLQAVVSQDVTKKNFCFVPDLGKYDRTYTDEYLIKKWNITEDEWKYIDSKIK